MYLFSSHLLSFRSTSSEWEIGVIDISAFSKQRDGSQWKHKIAIQLGVLAYKWVSGWVHEEIRLFWFLDIGSQDLAIWVEGKGGAFEKEKNSMHSFQTSKKRCDFYNWLRNESLDLTLK